MACGGGEMWVVRRGCDVGDEVVRRLDVGGEKVVRCG